MNISFLNSVYLWGLPLSLLPLVLHLLLRKPPKTVYFSDLRFLKAVYERFRPRKRFQELLLLLIRMLALACLLIFFSRPVMNIGGKAAEGDSVALVILLDASYSTRYQESGWTNFSRAGQMAGTALEILRENDRSSLVVFSDKIISLSQLTSKHKDIARELKSVQPTYRGSNLLVPLQAAYQLLSNSGASNKAILVLSDMAKHAWLSGRTDGKEPSIQNWEHNIPHFDPQVRVLYPKFSGTRKNVSVVNALVSPDNFTGLVNVQVELKNWDADPVSGVPVFLDLGSSKDAGSSTAKFERRSEAVVDLKPFEKKTVSLTAPMPGGILLGKVSARADNLCADDSWYFSREAPRGVKVLCVEDHAGIAALSGESYFLRQALAAPPTPFEVAVLTQSEIKRTNLKPYDSVVLVNPSELDTDASSALKAYVDGGGSLLLTLGARSVAQKLGAINDILPCSLLEARDTGGMAVSAGRTDAEEMLKSFASDYDWEKLNVYKIIQPVIKEYAETWLTLGDGTPLLVFSADRRSAVWTSTIDPSWNNFVSKPVFAPFFRLVLQTLSAKSLKPAGAAIFVGGTLQKKLPGLYEKDSVSIISPSGENVDFRIFQKDLTSVPLEEPGLYSMILKGPSGRSLESFSVNVDQSKMESDCSLIEPSDLAEVLPGGKFAAVETGGRFRASLLAALRGKELSRFFLLAAGFLLLAEIFMITRKET